MGETVTFPADYASRARRDLVAELREIADAIETGTAETAPYAACVILSGAEQHEVLHSGYRSRDDLRSAVQAAKAIHLVDYETVGGNIRPRTAPQYDGRSIAKITPIVTAKDTPND
jgi:hypothetical protein